MDLGRDSMESISERENARPHERALMLVVTEGLLMPRGGAAFRGFARTRNCLQTGR